MNQTGYTAGKVIGKITLIGFASVAKILGEILLYLSRQATNLEQEGKLLNTPVLLPPPAQTDDHVISPEMTADLIPPAPDPVKSAKPKLKPKSKSKPKVRSPQPKLPEIREPKEGNDNLDKLLADLPIITLQAAQRRAKQLGLNSQRASRENLINQILAQKASTNGIVKSLP